jgi:hypothetical protein
VAVFYLLLVNAFVGFQWLDDGSIASMSVKALFLGTIAGTHLDDIR